MPAFRHRAAHFALKKMGFFNRGYTENIAGTRFRIPIINGRKTYISELWMIDLLRRLFEISEGGFVDVGVNLGQTLLKVASLDRSRPYTGFEPNPTCVDYLWKLIEANSLDYQIVPAGIAAQTGILQLEMFREEETDPSASLIPGFREGVVSRRNVVVFSPDDLPPGTIPDLVAIVKIDVEGGELGVIEGIAPLLAKDRPFVVMEILPCYTADTGDRLERQEAIERDLAALDYRMYRINRDSDENLAGLEAISEIGIHGDLGLSDYVMVPAEKSEALEAVFDIAGS